MNSYDLIIIGGGPGGLSAAIYAARDKLKTVIIEKQRLGGQIVTTNELANYPGSVRDETGPALIERMVEQVEKFNVERVTDEIQEVILEGEEKIVKGQNGEYKAKTIIISTGAKPRLIGCPGEKEFIGRGVSYCSTCDGDFFTGLDVYVVGGGNSALQESLHLTKFAKKVTIIHRSDEFTGLKDLQERVIQHENIDIIYNTQVKEIKGEGVVNGLVLENLKTGEITQVDADNEFGTFGLFVFIGYIPQTDLFKNILENENGYITTDKYMKTSIEGVFAVGDCRNTPLRQAITAAADGAIAATEAQKYISS